MRKIAFVLVIGFLIFKEVKAQQPAEIIEKSEKVIQGNISSYSEMSIVVVRPTWQRTMKMKAWTKGSDYSLILITEPAKEKGISFLKREKEVWNWVPSIERTIKLPPSMMMQSWMGTDLTNDNLVKESSYLNDYEHALMGDTLLLERSCWKLMLKAKTDAPVVWDKVYLFISKKEYLQVMTLFYDEDGFLVNTMKVIEVRQVRGKEIATILEIEPEDNPGYKTIIKIEDVVFDEPYSDAFFTIRNLKKIR